MTTITTRTGKGSALTHQELDDNFSNLNSGKLETSGNVSQSGNVAVTGQVSAATISATGNVTGNYILGNGSQLTGITGGVTSAAGNNLNFQYNNSGAFAGVPNTYFYSGNGTIEIASAKFEAGAGPSSQITVPGTAGYVSVVGNVIAGNVTTTGVITATGNIQAGNVRTVGLMSATGNISGNYFIGNGSQLTGITGGNATPGGSANTLQFNNGGVFGGISDSFHYTANGITEISKVRFSSTAAGGGSGELFVPGTAGYVSVVGNIIGGNISSAGQISAAGNVTAGYFVGNGSLLSNITGANVTGTVATANIANSVAGSNVTGSVAQANVANTANAVAGANVSGQVANALVAGTVYTNAQPNITSVGTLTSVSVTGNTTAGNILTGGTVSASGNITGNYILGNGSQLTGLAATYGNANVTTFLAAYGSNTISTTGNISASYFAGDGSQLTNLPVQPGTYANANVAAFMAAFGSNTISTTGTVTAGNVTGGNIITGGVISAAGNITGNYILGNGSQLTGLPTGYSNADVNNHLAAFGSNVISTTGNVTAANLVSTGGIFATGGASLTGTIYSATALSTGGLISAAGNITGAYLFGNGSQLTGISGGGNAVPSGSNTQLQFNNDGAFAGNAAMTFDVASGNVTLGNIRFNNNVIVNSNTFQSNTNPNPGRIIIGTGRNGNYAGLATFGNNGQGARLFVQDEIFKYDDGLRTSMVVGSLYANLSGGNIGSANSNSRLTAVAGETYVISGNAVNSFSGTVRAASFSLNLGNSANTSNAFVNVGAAVQAFTGVNAGSSANTLAGTTFSTTLNGAVANLIGYSFAVGGSANVTGNVAGYFMGNTTSQYGFATANIARNVTNYHAFRNDDDLARSRLGMLERFHELAANTANTTGTVDIDKNSGQVQTIYPTGNITVGTLSNFVTRVTKPDATFVNTADTVTVIIQQGATPYTVTMPTGNANIRYASGISTVTSTANTTVMLSITGTYNYQTSANQYLITISPEFS